MRRFSLYKRGKYFYARFWNPETRTYTGAISTRETEKEAAIAAVYHWEHYGISDREQSVDEMVAVDTVLHHVRTAPLSIESASRIVEILKDRGFIESATLASDGPDTEPLIQFLERFWDYDESPYVREKLAYNHSIGRRHCYEQKKRLHHWRDYFGPDTRLRDVTRDTLKAFQLYLRDKELAPKTVNAVVSVGTVAFAWATEQAILTSNPAANLKKFSGKSKARGILTPQQANDLFSVAWPDERARVGNLVAMTTGLRAGEIVALRVEDIGEDRLWVRHSWSFADGLKAPKNGEEHIV
ncbi:MAG: tyrosine-type recombinase/integrase, partial [Spirochaetaceae bacterium]